LTKQILYTALYTVYANIIDSSDGSVYSAAAATYGSRFLTIGSSPGWAYIGGGYLRCIWDQGRDVYHLLSLIDPPVLKELLHGYMATYDVNKVMLGNLDAYCKGCWNDQQFGMYSAVFLRAYLQGIQGVDYNKAEKYIADTYLNPNNTMTKL